MSTSVPRWIAAANSVDGNPLGICPVKNSEKFMAHADKVALRIIISKLIDIYEAVSNMPARARRYRSFVNQLSEIFVSVFGDVKIERCKFMDDASKKTEEYHILFFPAGDYTQRFGNNDGDVSVVVTPNNLVDFLLLFGGLKGCISSGKYIQLFVSGKDMRDFYRYYRQKNGDMYDVNEKSLVYEVSAVNDTDSADENSFFNQLIFFGFVDDEDSPDTVKDFFHGSWRRFPEFVRSALVCFHITFGDFKSIHICKLCGKMFLPERSGDERGLFCSASCRIKYYRSDNKILTNCIQNQKRRLDTLKNYLAMFDDVKTPMSKIVIPSVATDCRRCETMKSATEIGSKVKAGMCPVFQKNKYFLEATKLYREKKEYEKRNKIKKKMTSGFEESYTVHD